MKIGRVSREGERQEGVEEKGKETEDQDEMCLWTDCHGGHIF